MKLKNKIFGNVSSRAGENIREDMEFMGPVRVKQVEEAQQKIAAIIRRPGGIWRNHHQPCRRTSRSPDGIRPVISFIIHTGSVLMRSEFLKSLREILLKV